MIVLLGSVEKLPLPHQIGRRSSNTKRRTLLKVDEINHVCQLTGGDAHVSLVHSSRTPPDNDMTTPAYKYTKNHELNTSKHIVRSICRAPVCRTCCGIAPTQTLRVHRYHQFLIFDPACVIRTCISTSPSVMKGVVVGQSYRTYAGSTRIFPETMYMPKL